jgi:hypothetical protein
MNSLPDTWTYFYAGYAVILLSVVGYAVSLFVRWRRVKTRLDAARKRGK